MKEKIYPTVYKSLLHKGYKLFVLILLYVLICSPAFGQLTANHAPNLITIINNIVGNGIQVSNISYTGDPSARGLFNGTSSNIGLQNGIILSTGVVDSAKGPNDDPIGGSCLESDCVKSTDFGRPGDTDLEAFEGCSGCTHDAAYLEFNFIPQSTPLSFNYVFASEECPCFVCSSFNDVFGFFISGPNPNPLQPAYNKQNIAYIPGTLTYVCINSVNDGSPGFDPITGKFFSTADCVSLNYSSLFVNNGDGSTPALDPTVQYNGFTKPFAASVDVIPCQTYHIKIAIADVGDGNYDSAVLLQQGSFASPSASISNSFSKPNVSSKSAVEGCSDAFVCFNLPSPLSTDYLIPLQYSGTAPNNGNYYPVLQPSITIHAGQIQACMTVSPTIQPGNNTNEVIITAQTSKCGSENDTIKILPNSVLTATPNPATVSICKGLTTTISVNVSGGISSQPYLYAWSDGETNVSSIQVSPPTTKIYTVTVTDACGATATANIQVITQPPPVISISKDTAICVGTFATLKVTGANAGATFLWNTGDVTSSINVSPAAITQYKVTVAYVPGCFIYDSTTVSVNPLPGVSAGNNTSVCSGLSVTLVATSPSNNLKYLWSNGQTNPSITVSPNKTTVYSVIATDANKCSSSAQVNVTVNANPVPVGISQQMCFGDSAVLTVTGAGNGGTYVWNTGSVSSSITVKPNTSTAYSVVLTNKNGCTDDTTLQVTVNPLPVPVLPADFSICQGIKTSISASGALANGKYIWNNGDKISTIIVSPQADTTYVVTVTTQYSCSATDSVKVTVNKNPIANAGNDTAICDGAFAILHGSGGLNYLWSTGATKDTIHVNPNITTIYTLTVTNANGCFGTASVTVTVNPIPTSDFTISPKPVCVKNQTTITYTGKSSNTATFIWDINGNNTYSGQGPFQVAWDTAGTKTITLTVIDKNCSSTETINTLLVNPMPVANFVAQPDSDCQPLTVQFTDSSKFINATSTYLWNFGDGQTSTNENPSHIYNASGKFTVSLTVNNSSVGCSDTKTINDMIDVFANPVAKLYVVPGNTVSELDPTVFVFSNSIGKIVAYKWTLGNNDSIFNIYTDSSFTYTFKNSGTYRVKLLITNTKGCTDTTSGIIIVKPDFTLYVPNAFMPTRCKESQNCWFFVKGTNIRDFKIWIYSRWGELVYTSSDMSVGWDGKINGIVCMEGVYIYRIDYKGIDNKPRTIWGNVTLVK